MSNQYRQLKGIVEVDTANIQKKFRHVAEERLLNGEFAKEFTTLDKYGPGIQKKLEELYEKANQSELAQRRGPSKRKARTEHNLESSEPDRRIYL